jgi:hypothetical protein
VEGRPLAVVGKSDAGSLNSLAGVISRRQSPARAAASVVQIWAIVPQLAPSQQRPSSCAAPWGSGGRTPAASLLPPS